jgi:hypothetical protein
MWLRISTDFLQHADCQCVAVYDTFRDRRESRAHRIDEAYAPAHGPG